LRVLVSTFKQGDLDKVLQAMRSLSYDRLALIGMPGIKECEDLRRIKHLEEMAGHHVEISVTEDGDFISIVSQVAPSPSQPTRETTSTGPIPYPTLPPAVKTAIAAPLWVRAMPPTRAAP